MFAGTPAAAELAGAEGAELAGAAAELAGAAADDAAVDGAAAALEVAAGADEAAGVADFFELHAVATRANAVIASTAEVLRLRAVMRIILFPSNVVTVPGLAGLLARRFHCRRTARARIRRIASVLFGTTTLTRSRPPVTMFCTCAATFMRVSASWMQPITTIAITTPKIVPRPPKMETPPSRTAATTVSSSPVPAS